MDRTIKSSNLLQRFADDGSLVEETQLLSGKPHGISKVWTSTGVLIGQATYYHGKLSGEVLTWNVLGKLVSKMQFDDGELHGEYRTWWDNGEIKEVGCYSLGARIGPCVWYDENGKVVQRIA